MKTIILSSKAIIAATALAFTFNASISFGEPPKPNTTALNIAKTAGSVVGGTIAGGGIVSVANGAVIGSKVVDKTTNSINTAIDKKIETHFKNQDQKFANENGFTIKYPDGTEIKPQN